MNRIQRLHGGQLLIIWLLLLLVAATTVVWWFLAVAAYDLAEQAAVDASPAPHVVIDGIALDYPARVDRDIAAQRIYRERYAHRILLSRGVPEDQAATRANEFANDRYYDSTRAYYDGIRARYQNTHRWRSTFRFAPPVLLVLVPIFGVWVTWVWLSGRRKPFPA